MGKKGTPLGKDGKSRSRNNSGEANIRVGGMKHERKEQPRMEMREEIRPFREKSRSTGRCFRVRWW